MTRSTIACVAEQGLGDAVPARAATASRPSLLRVSGIAGIAIAARCIDAAVYTVCTLYAISLWVVR